MSGKSSNPTIKERLACMETKQDSILEKLDNHLKHHWEFTIVLLGAVGVEAVAFLVLVIKHVL